MKATLGQVRRIISEQLKLVLEGDERAQKLQAVAQSGRPYLVGQWKKVNRYDPEFKGIRGVADCWTAVDPEIGPVYLTFDSDSQHVNVKNSRLRDPSRTRYNWEAILSLKPFTSFPSYESPSVFRAVSVGESDKKREKEEQVRRKMQKLFGVDPFSWKDPVADPAVSKDQAADRALDSVLGTGDTPVPMAGKQYKIYGRKGSSPAHTRYKGKAFVAGADTKFKNGDRAFLSSKDDGKLNVKKVDSDHAQVWEPETE